jgi:hypothetical protein
MNAKISVQEANAAYFPCDVIVLKFAQQFYGVDDFISSRISSNPLRDISPPVGKHVLLPSEGKIAAKNVLFVGVGSLYEFDYAKIREFANSSLLTVSKLLPDAMHVAMTVHGMGYGLDERESFLAQIAGILDALHNGSTSSIKKVTIVELDEARAVRLKRVLKANLPEESPTKKRKSARKISPSQSIASAGIESENKPHIFIAMPFNDAMEDTFNFGIKEPINAAGFLCERVDMSVFTGDILTRIKSRIETAILVIADLSGANPNVYLEVEYAWGKNRPTLLLCNKSEERKFDVQGQRCIVYKNISDLAKQLKNDLAALK